jgi:hypothetical protein
MFERTCGSIGLFSVATAATSFLHHHHLIKAIEVNIQDACKFATIQKIG